MTSKLFDASALGAELDAGVRFCVLAQTLTGDHGQITTDYVVAFIADLVRATVVISLIDLASLGPRLQRIQGLREETLLACIRESKLDSFWGFAGVRLILVILQTLRFHDLTLLSTVFLVDIA